MPAACKGGWPTDARVSREGAGRGTYVAGLGWYYKLPYGCSSAGSWV